MKGRKPKPAARQIAEGDPRKRGVHKLRELANAEPQAVRGLPDAPEYLGEIAKQVWKFWADELAEMNQDFKADAVILEGACVNYEAAVLAYKQLQDEGQTIEERALHKGKLVVLRTKAHPAEAIRNRAWALVIRFCAEQGLTLISRTRLTIDKADKLPDLAAILAGPRREDEDKPTVQ